MLPVVSSIYNLLGLMPPSILKGRRALYKLCSKKFNWNEPNNENVKKLWQKRQSELKLLKHIKLKRCYKPTEVGKVVSCSLNYFLDELQSAYDQTTHVILTEIIQQNQNYLWQLPYIDLQAKYRLYRDQFYKSNPRSIQYSKTQECYLFGESNINLFLRMKKSSSIKL